MDSTHRPGRPWCEWSCKLGSPVLLSRPVPPARYDAASTCMRGHKLEVVVYGWAWSLDPVAMTHRFSSCPCACLACDASA